MRKHAKARSHVRIIAFAFLVILLPNTLQSQSNQNRIENIVLVHGAWADGSSWSRVIRLIAERGFSVAAVQLSLTSLQDDVATTNREIERLEKSHPGPVLLVGHSYGGTVITEAGSNSNVKGLVYVAAFAPEPNQSSLELDQLFPKTPVAAEISMDRHGLSTLTRQGIFDDFAQDLTDREKEVLFATQGPTAETALGAPVKLAAWQTKPSWFVVAANDRVISPDLEWFEAQRMNAMTITVPTSHVALLAAPQVVSDFIALAAQSLRSHTPRSSQSR